MNLVYLIGRLFYFYQLLIIVYVLMSWFRPTGALYDVYRTLGTITEPWLGIFRRLIPPLGMVDISPIIAIIALQLVARLLTSVLSGVMG